MASSALCFPTPCGPTGVRDSDYFSRFFRRSRFEGSVSGLSESGPVLDWNRESQKDWD